ncbi:MAG: hypothetical protein ACC661_00735 [Verrucomicrobiales bacterium]
MKTHPDTEGSGNPGNPENDKLWKLLLAARKPEAGPFFTRNVVREVRLLESAENAGLDRGGTWLSFFSLRRVALTATAAAAAIVVMVMAGRSGHPTEHPTELAEVAETPEIAPSPTSPASPAPPETSNLAEASLPPPAAPAANEREDASFDMGDYQDELELIDYLDQLLAVQDVGALDDEALAELLF